VEQVSPTAAEWKAMHRSIKKIGDDLERFSLNTCVSGFMICVNELTAMNCHKQEILLELIRLLAPFAPFISEELWQVMGMEGSIHVAPYPKADDKYLVEDSFEYPVSVNGKTRSKLSFPLDMPEADIQEAVRNDEFLQKYYEGKPLKKIIVVKGRIINVVV
jgi:leucyl-tRNA synthetase